MVWMDVLSTCEFGGDWFTHDNARMKARKFVFHFLFVTLVVAYFGLAEVPFNEVQLRHLLID